MTDSSFKHVILTRFNVASPGREQQLRLQPGWLDRRLELFRDYCLPGVASQTNKNFDWYILFDEQTPQDYRDIIGETRKIVPWQPVYTPLFMMNELAPKLAGSYQGFEWLLTSRLDSDDVLASDFVERLHGLAASKSKQVFNFDNGLILSTGGDKPALYKTVDDCNPFAALLEPMSAAPATIWGETHRNITKLGPVRNIGGAPAWVQVVHGGNVTNEVRGQRTAMRGWDSLFPKLNLSELGSSETALDVAWENVSEVPRRLLRRIVRKVNRRLSGQH